MGNYLSLFSVLFLAASLAAPPVPRQVTAGAGNLKDTTDIAVVVNAGNPTDNLSLDELKKVLLGQQSRWKNKSKIAVVLRQPGVRERTVLLVKVLQMTEQDFKKSWLGAVFRGEADAEPFVAPSNGSASSYLDVYPGGIAFLPGTDVRRDLKVLKVNGHLPGDSEYPLK